MDSRFLEWNYNEFPFFVSEGFQNPHSPLILYSVSRSLVSHIAGGDKYYLSYLKNRDNELPFKDKKDLAVFRGACSNNMRDNLAFYINTNHDSKLYESLI